MACLLQSEEIVKVNVVFYIYFFIDWLIEINILKNQISLNAFFPNSTASVQTPCEAIPSTLTMCSLCLEHPCPGPPRCPNHSSATCGLANKVASSTWSSKCLDGFSIHFLKSSSLSWKSESLHNCTDNTFYSTHLTLKFRILFWNGSKLSDR